MSSPWVIVLSFATFKSLNAVQIRAMTSLEDKAMYAIPFALALDTQCVKLHCVHTCVGLSR